jgi:multidrug efflux pump subunit AcrA (membrane-fusion protein)
LGLAACSPRGVDSPKPSREAVVPVTVTSVKFIEMDRAIPVVGTLFAKDEAIISAEVEGQVEKTMAEFGDRVAAGQEIAQIDTTTYEALSRQAAANLARAKATTANAEHNLNRVQDLQTNNIASASDFDKGLRRS